MRRNPLTTQNRIQRGIASIQRQLQQSQPTQHPIEYTQQQLQPAALQDTQSKMDLGYNPQQALTYTQGSHHQMDFTQPLNNNQHIPIAQENMQIEPYQSQPAEIEKI